MVAVGQGLVPAPTGVPPHLPSPGLLLPRLLGDLLLVAGLSFAVQGPLLLIPARFRSAVGRVGFPLAGFAGFVVVLLAAIDAEVYRYQVERLSFFMLVGYRMDRDPAFTWQLLRADGAFVGVAAALLVAVAYGVARLGLRDGEDLPPPVVTASTLVVAALGGAVFQASGMAPAEWLNARPPAWRIASEIARVPRSVRRPSAFQENVAALQSLLRKPERWYQNRSYPLWHQVADDNAVYDRFRARPEREKPDVVLVVFESLRGWELDFRRPDAAATFPALHRLFRERGRQFVAFHANGYPSVEGWVGLHLGIWPHPGHLLLLVDSSKRFLALPDILGRAGYWRAIATPEPWEEIDGFYKRWYDERDQRADTTDREMVRRLIEKYDQAPPGKPRLLTLLSVSTHPPGFQAEHAPGRGKLSPREAYLEEAAETDRVLGILFDHLRASGRWDRTIVAVVGDHATPNGWIAFHGPRLGSPNCGETWTSMLLAVPGREGGAIDTRVASQVDLPPTLLAALRLDVSNHFMGRNLLDQEVPDIPAVAARFEGMAVTDGSLRFHFRLDDERSFLRKFRWDVPANSASEDGRYRHGEELAVVDGDRDYAERLRGIATVYKYLVSADRIAPPEALP